jgi:hypothetical protein
MSEVLLWFLSFLTGQPQSQLDQVETVEWIAGASGEYHPHCPALVEYLFGGSHEGDALGHALDDAPHVSGVNHGLPRTPGLLRFKYSESLVIVVLSCEGRMLSVSRLT